MRRDCVTQVIVQWSSGEIENFATSFEAQSYINYYLDELGVPIAAWLEDMHQKKKWDFQIVDDNGVICLE